MPTPDVERALAEGAARSRTAVTGPGSPGAVSAPVRTLPVADDLVRRVMAWYGSLPPQRRKLIVGFGLFLLFDLVAGLAAAAANGHF